MKQPISDNPSPEEQARFLRTRLRGMRKTLDLSSVDCLVRAEAQLLVEAGLPSSLGESDSKVLHAPPDAAEAQKQARLRLAREKRSRRAMRGD